MKPLADLNDDEFNDCLRRAVALPEVPPAVTHLAIGLWPARAALPASPLRAALRRIAAVLTVDSWANGATALGLRGARSATRQLLFSAEGCDIDLRISSAGEAYALAGQVLGPFEAGTVELASVVGGDTVMMGPTPTSAALDGLGEFRLDTVAGGVYELRLYLDGNQIVLPSIEVGPARR